MGEIRRFGWSAERGRARFDEPHRSAPGTSLSTTSPAITSDLAQGPGVPGELLVAGEKGDALAEVLGQQQAVEGIFVQRGQAVDIHRVLAGNGKLGVAVVEQSPAQQARLDDEVRPSQGLIDGDLPQAGGAENEA